MKHTGADVAIAIAIRAPLILLIWGFYLETLFPEFRDRTAADTGCILLCATATTGIWHATNRLAAIIQSSFSSVRKSDEGGTEKRSGDEG
jgi:hypothetical protein